MLDKMVESSEFVTYKTEKCSLIKSHDEIPAWKFWKKRRYVNALLTFISFFVLQTVINLGITMTAMTEKKIVYLDNETTVYESEFEWDSAWQGYTFSACFYGFVITQMFGGILGAKYGGSFIYGIGVFVPCVINLITPPLVKINGFLLMPLRFFIGLFEGVTLPSALLLWGKWAPPLERSRLISVFFFGSFLGVSFTDLICPYLSQRFGWTSLFYVPGGIGLILMIIWFLTVSDSPESDRWISQEELTYIQSTRGGIVNETSSKYPWRKILTSLPVYAIIVAQFAEMWATTFLLTQFPLLLRDGLLFDLKEVGLISGISVLCKALASPISGCLADWLQIKGYLTAIQTRKLFTCGSHLTQGVLWISAGIFFSPITSAVCLVLADATGGFSLSGYSVNYLEIAPQYAGLITGFGNTLATLPGIIGPTLDGYIVQDQDPNSWRTVLYIVGGICIFACIFYGMFSSSDIQPWALESEENTSCGNKAKEQSGYVPNAENYI